MGLFDGTPLERPVLCENCGLEISVCQCDPASDRAAGNQAADTPDVAPARQRLRVRVEKRKRGKIVTRATGFTGSERQLRALFTELKNACGAGGCLEVGALEIQGDHRQVVEDHLKRLGYRVEKKR